MSDFYRTHSRWTNPGPFRDLVRGWGRDPTEISQRICELLIHLRGREAQITPLTREQTQDLLLRSTVELIPAGEGRRKVGGVCRDFALLAATAFREQGVAARLRAGFADYFAPGAHEDHWVCEWRDGTRWKLLDVEVAGGASDTSGAPFDPTDTPRDRFLSAAEAWRRTKTAPETAAAFGVPALGLRGRWFIARSLQGDMAALRKLELKPWDEWGLPDIVQASADEDWSPATRAALERLVVALEAAETFEGPGDPLADAAGCDLPDEVTSWPFGAPTRVRLDGMAVREG